MAGISREVAEHELRITSGSKPVHQRLRCFDDERCRAMGEEIAKLLAAVMGPGAGAGVVLISPEGNKLHYMIRLHFSALNNVIEYEGLINGLRIAIELGATRLYAYGDSKLVVDQVMKESNCESSLMNAYCQKARKLEDKFRGFELHQVPHSP
ncbi:uncharacterized protein LOC112900668 [Panicum hallii]|uniref:uncharacterized protein LOC112900668 n=1 Tax=Panicum hallii TaxID=206008 RepID=UPI000DF4F0DA|nr:uncharacterized protein LOC112900668 [Panicum hallii]